MKTSEVDILIVPGRGNSGPDHWQSRWERNLKTARRIEQDDWSRPRKAAWTARIVAAVRAVTRPAVLVGHDCGVAAIVHAAPLLAGTGVRGAFLVAPGSEDLLRRHVPDLDPGFFPYPRDPLPFPSNLIASRNDPFGAYDDAADLALAWGSLLIDAGESGHLDTASGHGPWPDGLLRFGMFLRALG